MIVRAVFVLLAVFAWLDGGAALAQTPTVGFDPNIGYTVNVNEGDGVVTLYVCLSEGSSETVKVDYATSNGSATSPSDYTGASGTLTFAPWETKKQIQITIIDDSTVEDTEWFWVTLSNPENADLASPGYEMSVSIMDDDVPPSLPTVQLESTTYTVAENAGSVDVIITLSAAAAGTVNVWYNFTPGSPNGAQDGVDFTDPNGGFATFSIGQTSKTVTITILDNSEVQENRTFTVQLTMAEGATIGTPDQATITIVDDDVPPWGVNVSSDKSAICAGGQNSPPHQATITATLIDPGTGQPAAQPGVLIAFSTTAGTLSAASATTDGNGQASTTLTSNSYASEDAVQFCATVTSQTGASSTDTDIEFQAPAVALTAAYPSLVTGESTNLQASITWSSQPIASHGLAWRISKIWDAEDNQVYDGSGTPPSSYGNIQSGAAAETDSNGNGVAVYESSENGGNTELESSDQMVVFVTTGGNPKDQKKVEIKRPKLIIQRKLVGAVVYEVENLNINSLPGQRMNLKAFLDPAPKTVDEWQWTLPPVAFKDYTTSDDNGKLTALSGDDLKQEEIQFHWANGDDLEREIVAKAKIGSVWIEGKGKMTVKKVSVEFSAEIGDVFLGKYDFSDGNGEKLRLILAKGADGALPGIKFTGKVQIPAGFAKSTWYFGQLITSKNTFDIKEGNEIVKYAVDSKGAIVCDSPWPYGEKTHDTGDDSKSVDDSPNIRLDAVDGLVKASKQDSFSMYIMFKSGEAGSKYVPLSRLDWSWEGTAKKGDTAWEFEKDGEGKEMKKKDKKDAVPETKHPEWNKKWKDIPTEKIGLLYLDVNRNDLVHVASLHLPEMGGKSTLLM